MIEHGYKTALVLGGYGFIGRYIVRYLIKQGINVLIGTRALSGTLCPGDRRILLHKKTHPNNWNPVLSGVDVVINAVGILRERSCESYEQVHHIAVAALAQACHQHGIQLIHISALGLNNPVTSQFALSKKRGEQAIVSSGAHWTIIRSSLVEAVDGYGARWFHKVAGWPIHFAPSDATGLIAPVSAQALGQAVANIVTTTRIRSSRQIFEVSGGSEYSIFGYLEKLADGKHRPKIRIPRWLTRIAVCFLDLCHLTPLTYGHYELLKYPSTPSINSLNYLLHQRADS